MGKTGRLSETRADDASRVLCGVGAGGMRDVPLPVAHAHEVIVRVSAVGLCGTDAHISRVMRTTTPMSTGNRFFQCRSAILGHEISGCVEETGTEVNDLAPGDRVVIDQGLNCVICGAKLFASIAAPGTHINASSTPNMALPDCPAAWLNSLRCPQLMRSPSAAILV